MNVDPRVAITDIFMSAYNNGQVVVKAYQPPLNGWPKIGNFQDTTGAFWGVYALAGQPINYQLLVNLNTSLKNVAGVRWQHGIGSQAIAAILLPQAQVSYDFAELIVKK